MRVAQAGSRSVATRTQYIHRVFETSTYINDTAILIIPSELLQDRNRTSEVQ